MWAKYSYIIIVMLKRAIINTDIQQNLYSSVVFSQTKVLITVNHFPPKVSLKSWFKAWCQHTSITLQSPWVCICISAEGKSVFLMGAKYCNVLFITIHLSRSLTVLISLIFLQRQNKELYCKCWLFLSGAMVMTSGKTYYFFALITKDYCEVFFLWITDKKTPTKILQLFI